MTEQYWIGGFFVDVSRNQIVHNKQAQTLPPKALAVLTYLASRQGDVISQDELLDKVWSGTIVSPNSLQRCIAQLRKAFGDDGKAQGFIKTHAKKGYSLECDIRWEGVSTHHSSAQPTDLTSDTNSDITEKAQVLQHNTLPSEPSEQLSEQPTKPPTKSTKSSSKQRYALLIFAVALLVFGTIAAFTVSSPVTEVMKIKDIHLLTSTDNRELASAYSPDGQYIVFQRFPDVMCKSQLWAKHIGTQQEFQLTEELGSYGSLAFSQDGSALAFVKESRCTTPVEQKTCFQLQQVDFEQALLSPQTPQTLMECKHTEIKSPIWTSNNDIALLQKEQGRWKLISYAINDSKSTPLYALDNGSVVSFDYSHHNQIMALTTLHESGVLHIEKLDTAGNLLSSVPINYEDAIPKYDVIYPNFSPVDNHLIFSTGKQLFTVTFDGSIHPISMPLTDAIGTPLFHPQGKKMLAIKGYYDSDIATIPLAQFNAPLTNLNTQLNTESNVELVNTNTVNSETDRDIHFYTTIRSPLEENRAKFQPTGHLVAYSSEGDGTSQVWTASVANTVVQLSSNTKQLSHFATNTEVMDVLWAQDGNSVLVNASSQLTRIHLDGREAPIPFNYPINSLFHWDGQQTAIANILHQGVSKLVDINLASGDFSILSTKSITWADKTDDGTLVYSDTAGRIWQSGNIEHEVIPALINQGSDRHFVIHHNVIYGINDSYQLWRYDLSTTAFTILGQLPDTVDYITDINNDVILITLRVAARKNVVELTIE